MINFLSILFKRLDFYLIIDKSIDFILIFVGLILALMVENHINEKKINNEYHSTLIRLHTEISSNLLYINDVFDASVTYAGIVQDILNLSKNDFVETYPGTKSIKDAEPLDLEDRVYLSLDEDNFLNKALLADIIHLYSIAEKVSNERKETTTIIENMYNSYFALYAKNRLSLNEGLAYDVVNFNYSANKSGRYLASLQSSSRDFRATSKRVLNFIENEIVKYGESIDQSRNLSDYYWLSYASLMTSDPKKAYEYAINGIDYAKNSIVYPEVLDNENTSLYGRLNMLVVNAMRTMIDDTTFESDHKIDDILPHLEAWNKTGIYKELNLIYYLDYFHKIDDFDNFCKTFEELIELGVSSGDPLAHFNEHYSHYVNSWKNYMSRDRIQTMLLSSGIPMDTWNSHINPRNMFD